LLDALIVLLEGSKNGSIWSDIQQGVTPYALVFGCVSLNYWHLYWYFLGLACVMVWIFICHGLMHAI